MTEYKELVFYGFKINNNFFFLVLSSLFGWNIIKIKSACVLFKKKSGFFQIYGIFCLRNFLGCYRFFLQCLILKGMGYKNLILGSHLLLKLSQSHRLVYKVKKILRFFM